MKQSEAALVLLQTPKSLSLCTRPHLEPGVQSVCVAKTKTKRILSVFLWATGTTLHLPKENLLGAYNTPQPQGSKQSLVPKWKTFGNAFHTLQVAWLSRAASRHASGTAKIVLQNHGDAGLGPARGRRQHRPHPCPKSCPAPALQAAAKTKPSSRQMHF